MAHGSASERAQEMPVALLHAACILEHIRRTAGLGATTIMRIHVAPTLPTVSRHA